MLVTRRGEELHLVSQVDHGRLSGVLAAAWGNDRFAAPGVRDALVIGATHHDDGWVEMEPVYNGAEGRPAHFTEVEIPDEHEYHRRANAAVYERYELAGALSAMHRAGLANSRWGLGHGPPSSDPRAVKLTEDEERRWVAAIRRGWDFVGRRSAFEAEVWYAYEVLQALDMLALAVPLFDLSTPGGTAEAGALSIGLVDQPLGPRLIDNIPTRVGGDYVEFRIWVQEPARVLLRPWPFGQRELALEIPVRRIADRFYKAEEMDAVYRQTPAETVRLTLAAA